MSNILDADYVGMRGVLTNWAPLLNEGGAAAILGYFMNWTGLQQDGDATRAKNKRAIAPLLRSWLKKIEVRKSDTVSMSNTQRFHYSHKVISQISVR